ncbi:DUF6427 family protein [Salinimicrobium soli]|uniref:DUF6427 family protein n=1 Tax=Salinimicrobium soli TaxID=1254399 RepID=UPI003AAF87D9
MVASFFGKSKPINFILVALYITGFFILTLISQGSFTGISGIFESLGVLILILLSGLLLNFISGRNELTRRNSYKIVLFAGFLCMFPNVFTNASVIAANFFILLAFRRIISLRTQRQTIQKIFDATLWICVASLFHFWSILFLFLLYFGILVHVGHRFKNWLVPLIGFLAALSLVTCGDLLITDSFFTLFDWVSYSNFDFSRYRELPILIPTAFMFGVMIWASFFYLVIIQKASATAKTSLFIVLLYTVVALVVAIFAPTKDSSELLFLFFPLAIIVTNYFQMMKDKWFKETLLILILLLPVILQIFF